MKRVKTSDYKYGDKLPFGSVVAKHKGVTMIFDPDTETLPEELGPVVPPEVKAWVKTVDNLPQAIKVMAKYFGAAGKYTHADRVLADKARKGFVLQYEKYIGIFVRSAVENKDAVKVYRLARALKAMGAPKLLVEIAFTVTFNMVMEGR